MTPLARKIQARIKEIGLNPRRAALNAGLREDAVRDILRGKNDNPGQKTLVALAHVLNWRIEDLISTGNVRDNDTRIVSVPIISWVEAGSYNEVVDPYEPGSREREIQVPSEINTLFALEVRGDSMNLIAPDGATILVDYSQKDLVDGKLYVIKNGVDATFKRYRPNPDRFEPSSTAQHEIIFPDGPITVVGRVIQIITFA